MSLHWWSARDLAKGIAGKQISAVEVARHHLDRIEELNPVLRAVVSQHPASLVLDQARRADAAVLRGDELGPLHGLPTAVKDLMDVEGLPTTHGSAAHAQAAPATRDSVLAKNLRRAGALIIGKTNTPEHGLGTLTFNPVFGTTVNPWDRTRHAGGSSGGAAAAVAAGLLPIADGSDSGGSLRYPAAFCGIVGLRPTPGTVPSGRPGNGWSPHGVLGPMARSSADAAFFLTGISGPEERWPLAWQDHPDRFGDVPTSSSPLKLGWSEAAGGLEVDPDVARLHAQAREQLEAAGVIVVDLEPDFGHADEAWETIEMFEFFSSGRHDIPGREHQFRADYLRNVRQGAATDAGALANAFEWRTELFRQTAALLRDVDALVFPAAPVLAPPADQEWVTSVGGVAYDRYFRWQRMANRITVTGHPALVTPAGFSASGLPSGLQLVGRYRGDRDLLGVGAAMERILGHTERRPALIR